MNMAEAFDVLYLVAVSASPGPFYFCVWAEVYQSEGTTSGREEEPSGVVCIQLWIDEVYWFVLSLGGRAGCNR
tara:strand:+ start:236 stop:454 length:219 start_codon:yes stop_codon:yes gene_type:complete